jgi:hypothetical protein
MAALAGDYIVKTFDAPTLRGLTGSEGEIDLGSVMATCLRETCHDRAELVPPPTHLPK